MTVALSYYLEDVNARIEAGWTHLRLYRASAPEPASGFISQADTQQALVADTILYEFEDATGSPAHWYRAALWNNDLSELSTLGDPFRPDAVRMRDLMLAAAELAGAGFKSTCTAVGTVSSLVDETLLDSGVASDYLEGGVLWRPAAALAADEQRAVAKGGFDFTAGALRPVRSWENEPEEDEEYHLYLLLPAMKMAGKPFGWADAVREGLMECVYEDRVDVGTGTETRVDEFDLGPHLGWLREGDVRAVHLETYDEDTNQVRTRQNAGKNGWYWYTEPNGRGNVQLVVRPAPSVTQHVIVEGNRRDAEIYGKDDVTSCPVRLAARAGLWKAYEYLDRVHSGKYSKELGSAYRAFLEELRGERVKRAVQA